MKFRQWLREYQQISYQEYRSLEEMKQWDLEIEFRDFCRKKQMHDSQNWRKMTEEERERCKEFSERERLRYEKNLKIGGIDDRGNYTALHHR